MAEPDDRIRTDPKGGTTSTPPDPDGDELDEPEPDDEVDEWGYESFPASDPPQH
jgi:hypothetical protein